MNLILRFTAFVPGLRLLDISVMLLADSSSDDWLFFIRVRPVRFAFSLDFLTLLFKIFLCSAGVDSPEAAAGGVIMCWRWVLALF